jgi:hypothetical protein
MELTRWVLLIVVLTFMVLFYLIFFTPYLDPFLAKVPSIRVPKLNIWDPSPEERRRHALKALDLYANADISESNDGGVTNHSDYAVSISNTDAGGGCDAGGCGD